MSNERDESPVRTDESVARAYRNLADERAPEHLDRAVLGSAARAVRPGYARSRAWTRPLAWAATIALSVAIVLELTRTPAPEEIASWQAPAALDEAEAVAPANRARRDAGKTSAEGRSVDLIQDARDKTRPVQKTAVPVVPESRAHDESRAADSPVAAADQSSLHALAPEPAAAASGAETAVSDPGRCPAEATRQPSTWLECIGRLERAGLVDEAAEERELLRDAFPGFELP
jgi:hypothetical protein